MEQAANDDLCPTCDKCQQTSLATREKRGSVQQKEAIQLRAHIDELKAILRNVRDELHSAREESCGLHCLGHSDGGELPNRYATYQRVMSRQLVTTR